MTNEQKLKHIIEKCIEANPDIVINKNAQLIKFDHTVEYFKQTRPIRLADVLMALNDKYEEVNFEEYKFHSPIEIWLDWSKTLVGLWNLKDNVLEKQLQSTQDFIYEALSKVKMKI